jgi:dTDP-4-amino-4,6-dideoxygalactose transaminase
MIPFVDLKAQYETIRDEVNAAVSRVLESTQFVLGPEVEAFESEFAAYCGARHCVAVNSGTSALHLALLAAGVGPGDEVVTVSHTFVATAAAVRHAGARPVFADIDPKT